MNIYKTYYILNLDDFNEPDGTIKTITLSKKAYEEFKKEYIYIYENYAEALERALN